METFREKVKRLYYGISPQYRTLRRIEAQLQQLRDQMDALSQKGEAMFWWQMQRPGESMEQTRTRVFLAMPPAEGRLREIQMGNFAALQRLRQICEANRLSFWLMGGTLLGAVRHNGFIPWDDDVDVGMLRGDLEKLADILADDPVYVLRPFYRTDWKSFLYKMVCRAPGQPYWVDIFHYDGVDSRAQGAERTWERIRALREKNEAEKARIGRTLSRCYHDEPLEPADLERLEAARRRLQAEMPAEGEPDCLYRSLDTVYLGNEALLPRSAIFPLAEGTFEGERYPIPNRWRELLEQGYGAYMSLPPDVRPAHTIMYRTAEWTQEAARLFDLDENNQK